MLDALQASAIAEAIRAWPWSYPILSTLHIVGLGVLLGSILMLDAALLAPRLAKGIGAVRLGQITRPWTLGGFALAVVTGMLMFASDATALASNPAFLVKVLVILMAGINALQLHLSGALPPENVQVDDYRARVRLSGFASVMLWVSAVAAGRMIAFV